MTTSGSIVLIGIFCFMQTWIFVDALIGTALYCRDPDTGKLHAPNTTWPSTTFCGNYACKLRKKNDNATESKENPPTTDPDNPLTKITPNNNDNTNISPPENSNNNRQLSSDQLQAHNKKSSYEMAPKERSDTKEEISKPKNTVQRDNVPSKKHFELTKLEEALGDNDRYLSEEEIKIISELLYTVKKSDLEAIVDIYNLAQDIYNEMERPSSNDVMQKSNNNKPYFPLETAVKKNSYWYEPLHNDAALKAENQGDMLIEATNELYSSPPDISNAATTQNPQTYQQKASERYPFLNNLGSNFQSYLQRLPSKSVIQPIIPHQKRTNGHPVQPVQRVFAPQWTLQKSGEALIPNDDIQPNPVLLPYPLSFVRNLTSAPNAVYYGNNPFSNVGVNEPNIAYSNYVTNVPSNLYTINPDYTYNAGGNVLNNQYNTGVNNIPGYSMNNIAANLPPNPYNNMVPNIQSNSYNSVTNPPINPYNEANVSPQPQIAVLNPLVLDESINNNKRNSLTKFLTEVRVPILNNLPDTIYIPENRYAVENKHLPESKYITENSYEAEYKRALESKFIPDNSLPRLFKKPGWTADALPEHVIEAIRAKIENAYNSQTYKSYFPAKRMVKVEKIGKTVRRNETLSRRKREENLDDYEVVIESKTCITDETIGFFRKGNESEPFPNCCPQKIQVW